jgi:hypothetical protein
MMSPADASGSFLSFHMISSLPVIITSDIAQVCELLRQLVAPVALMLPLKQPGALKNGIAAATKMLGERGKTPKRKRNDLLAIRAPKYLRSAPVVDSS